MDIDIDNTADEIRMTAKELSDKYDVASDGSVEHPRFPMNDWIYEVSNRETRLGYWDWVASSIEMRALDDDNEEEVI